MQNLWDEKEVRALGEDSLALRCYSSQLLGRNPDLVLHGGGNTSLKQKKHDFFGVETEILSVKGSGWDLASMKPEGFSPVRMDVLMKLAKLNQLSDPEMVREQRIALLSPDAPNPSIEAILHAVIPFKYVDHTHADAVVTVSNTKEGDRLIEELYGQDTLIIPYVMPGFYLAKKVYELSEGADWSSLKGLVLLHHGVFSFGETAKESYNRMIELVSRAEELLKKKNAFNIPLPKAAVRPNPLRVAKLRKKISELAEKPQVLILNQSDSALSLSQSKSLFQIAARGPITPDHIIHTKRTPAIFGTDESQDAEVLSQYKKDYEAYFNLYNPGHLARLHPAPRWAVLQDSGILSFGENHKRAQVVSDITDHTAKAILWAEGFSEWTPLSEKELFEVEYWELEQAKLKKKKDSPPLEGKIALVTGAASGIGKSCALEFLKAGACVIGLDLSPDVATLSESASYFGIQVDLTKTQDLKASIEKAVLHFGGLDILVSNAGTFPTSKPIEAYSEEEWQKIININFNSHQYVLKEVIPFLELGIDPSILFIGSKNAAAPGPGVSAYSCSKAALAQLSRVAALELGKKGIRVNTLHPNQVFDTGIWTEELLEKRAKSYGLTIEGYKKNNILQTEITSLDVAKAAISLTLGSFSKTTGAQIPIDGGNDRVI